MRPANDSKALCTPPQSCLNPLLVLDQYLASLEQPRTDTSNSTLKETTTTLKRQDEILQTVEFLYGSALDGALSVLDSTTSSHVTRHTSWVDHHLIIGNGSTTNSLDRHTFSIPTALTVHGRRFVGTWTCCYCWFVYSSASARFLLPLYSASKQPARYYY